MTSGLFNQNIVIVLEGLPCVGKTSLAKIIAQEFNAVLVSELPSKSSVKNKLRKVFYLNDLQKSKKAYNQKPVVVDRYFLSTLAFEKAFQAVYTGRAKKITAIRNIYNSQNFRAQKLYKLLVRNKTLRCPNIVVYIYISPAESIRRRRLRRTKIDENNPWLNKAFLKKFQDYCLRNIEFWYKIKPIIINGNLTIKEIKSILEKEIAIKFKK